MTTADLQQLKNAALLGHSLLMRDAREHESCGLYKKAKEKYCKAWYLHQLAKLLQGGIDDETTISSTEFYKYVAAVWDIAGLDYQDVNQQLQIALISFDNTVDLIIGDILQTVNNPGGSANYIQYNDGSAFAGDARFQFKPTTYSVQIGTRNGAEGLRSLTVGLSNAAAGDNSVTGGTGNTNDGDNAAIFGYNNSISELSINSLVTGSQNTLGGTTGSPKSIVFGQDNTVSDADESLVGGNNNTVSGINNIVISTNATVDTTTDSGVLGGSQVTLPNGRTNAFVIGVTGPFTADKDNYTYITNLHITGTPAAGDSTMEALVLDPDGTVKKTAVIGGSGTDQYIPKFDGATGLQNSVIYNDTATGYIGINTITPVSMLELVQDSDDTLGGIALTDSADTNTAYIYRQAGGTGKVIFNNQGLSTLYIGGNQLGIGVDPQNALHVNGGITLNNVAPTAIAGTIKWNGTNFQGYNGSSWVNLDSTATANVTSVFGRTGAVVAAQDDYLHSQIFDDEPEKHRQIDDGSVSGSRDTLWSGYYIDASMVYKAGDTMTGKLQYSGTTHAGLRLNNLTGAQITALTPEEGDIVYNTDSNAVQVWMDNPLTWVTIGTGGGGLNNLIDDLTPQLGGNLDVNGKVIVDTNGNELLTFFEATSAVNYLMLSNAAAAASPSFTAVGTDANININMIPKGTGVLQQNGVRVLIETDTFDASKIDSGTFANARISAGSVTQHTAGLYLANLNTFTTETVPAAADLLAFWDDDAAEHKNITIDNFYGAVAYVPDVTAQGWTIPTTIGDFTAGSTLGDYDGNTLTTMWNDLLVPTILAYIATPKSTTVAGQSTETVEVGTTRQPTFTSTFEPGVINDGDDSVGPNLYGDAISFLYTLPDTTTENDPSPLANVSTFKPSAQIMGFGTNQWTADASHGPGSGAYYDNKGNAGSNLDPRSSGTELGYSNIVTGRFYAWYGSGADGTTPTNSAQVRALTDKVFLDGSYTGTFDISIPSGDREIYFSIPAQGQTVLVQYVESALADVTSSFTADPFNVDDAEPVARSYNTYSTDLGGTGYPSTATYRVTIS